MKQIREISEEQVKRACIKYDWLTCSDCAEYTAFITYISGLSYERINVDTHKLEFIARKIKQYSDTKYNVAGIMFIINAECCITYFE